MQAQTPISKAALAIQCVSLVQHAKLTMATQAIGQNGRIPDRYSAYFNDEVPGVSWSPLPGAQTYVLVVQDPDAPPPKPFVHWLLWNIPREVNAIPGGLDRICRPAALPGAIQGRNGGGTLGWFGVKPPPGHGVHHYHFQLFALSDRVDLGPDADVDALVNAMRGVAIAAIEQIGTYERP